jgi:RNA polymerase sigma factor (sigma-70 family)
MSLKMRASRILETPLRAFADKTFHQRWRHSQIVGDMPGLKEFEDKRAKLLYEYSNLPSELRQFYTEPLLNREQEYHLFRKYNFYKWQVINRRELFDSDLAGRVVGLCEKYLQNAVAVRQQIVVSNLRLVVNIVKQSKWYKLRSGLDRFCEMTSTGNLGIYAAIDYFDFRKGNKFSTYATYAVQDWLTRSITNEVKQGERFVVGMEEVLAEVPEQDQEELPEDPHTLVRKLLRTIKDARTKAVVERYYGIGMEDGKEQTLEVIADALNLSKERIRQIRDKGLSIIRDYIARSKKNVAAS